MLLLKRGRRKVGVLGRSRVERSVFWAPQGSILWADEESNTTSIPTPPTYLYGLGRTVKPRVKCEQFANIFCPARCNMVQREVTR